jgi:hypothetical protein
VTEHRIRRRPPSRPLNCELVNGRKRHVVVDTLGLLLAVVVVMAAYFGDRIAAYVLLG